MFLVLRSRVLIGLVCAAAVAANIASCSAGGDSPPGYSPGQGGGGNDASITGTGGQLPAGNGNGGGFIDTDAADPGDSAKPDVPTNLCGSQCGNEERCEPQFLGYDDNCNGIVDEGCACTPGLSHWCFKGDPASRNKGACKDGTEKCDETGHWGTCFGGLHADATDNCLNQGTQVGCHDLSVAPFTTVNLKDGTGTFSDATTSWSFQVECPPQIPAANCPQVQNPNSVDATFTPLQSGQYTVTFTKNGGAESCTYSIYVGSGGLRIELNWDHQGEGAVNHYTDDAGTAGQGKGPDLDLHVHRPGFKTVGSAARWG